MLDDLRHAARGLGRAKTLTAVLLLSLALGTGANAAVSGIVYALLIRGPAGVEDAGELASIYTSEFSGSAFGRSSYPDFQSVKALPAVGAAAAFNDDEITNLSMSPRPDSAATVSKQVRVSAVTPGFFDVLGLRPLAGDFASLTTDPAAVVVSDTVARDFGDPASMIGAEMRLGTRTRRVVAVAPAGFRGLRANRASDAWTLLSPSAERGDRRLSIVSRPAEDLRDLEAPLGALATALAESEPATNRGSLLDPAAPRRFRAAAFTPHDPESGRGLEVVAFVVLGAVALLLASACVNAGTLLLSRAMARKRELAVKLALGATRGRLIRQLFAESILICVAGGALGLLLAAWTLMAIPALFSPDHAEALDTTLDPLLLMLTLGIAIVAGVLFGIAPALHGTDAPASLALRGDAGGIGPAAGGARTRTWLLGIQMACSTLLLATTAFLVTGLARALDGDFGFGARSVAVLNTVNPGGNCQVHDPLRGARFQAAVADQLPKLPGITAVGWASAAPLGRTGARLYAIEAGATMLDRVEFQVTIVSPSYFRAMQIPVIEGRPFDDGDRALTHPVAVVDELLARRQFGTRAVGQHLIDARGDRVKIVGVVRSGRFRTLQETPAPTVYRPLAQEYMPCGFLFVRTAGEPGPAIAGIVRDLEKIDRGVTIPRAVTIEEHLSEALAIDRITTTLVALCGLIALALGGAGVYGAIGDTVDRRTREIGLRVALGAGPRQVVTLVLTETAYITAGGVGAGLVAAFFIDRLAGASLYGLPAMELSLLARTPAILLAAVAIAAAVPLRRALAVEPTIALRAN